MKKCFLLVILVLLLVLTLISTARNQKKSNQDNKNNKKSSDESFEDFVGDLSIDDFLDSPYSTLRIPPWSSWTEIKARYSKLVKKYHPDKADGSEESKQRFMEIQEAYQKLKKQRKVSDEDNTDVETPIALAVQDVLKTGLAVIQMA